VNKDSRISVVINTLNEEISIDACIKSVQGFADEIVVCDMYSDDRTVEIAKSYGAKVVFHERTGFVEPARFFAISQASCEWVLVLDADERLTGKLATRLHQVCSENRYDLVSFWFRYWYFGDWVLHGGFFSGNRTRFFRKEIYQKTYSIEQETVHSNFRALEMLPNQLHLSSEFYIDHYAYETVEKYISKTLGMYARFEAEKYHKEGKKFSVLRLICQPVKIFLGRYFIRQGYRDGMRGFILCVLYAGYFFAIYANLWSLEQHEGTDRGIV
jgi:glycosyltransferase involved in cell wall biosynthesis